MQSVSVETLPSFHSEWPRQVHGMDGVALVKETCAGLRITNHVCATRQDMSGCDGVKRAGNEPVLGQFAGNHSLRLRETGTSCMRAMWPRSISMGSPTFAHALSANLQVAAIRALTHGEIPFVCDTVVHNIQGTFRAKRGWKWTLNFTALMAGPCGVAVVDRRGSIEHAKLRVHAVVDERRQGTLTALLHTTGSVVITGIGDTAILRAAADLILEVVSRYATVSRVPDKRTTKAPSVTACDVAQYRRLWLKRSYSVHGHTPEVDLKRRHRRIETHRAEDDEDYYGTPQ